jgi:PAS domain S-box-containing protein
MGPEGPHTMNLRIRLLASGGVASAILCCVGTLSYRSMLQVDEDHRWVGHTHRVLQKLDELVADMMSTETNQRAYVRTGDESYLSGYRIGREYLREGLNEIGELTSDNRRQQQALQQLRPLISVKLTELEEGVTVCRQQGAPTRAAVCDRVEKQSLVEITSHLTAMKLEEGQLLSQRLQAAKAASFRTKAVIVFGNVLAVLLLCSAAFEIHREITRRDRVERALHQSEERFRLMVSSVREYAIFMLGPKGHVVSWNYGARQIKGYQPEEIIGQHLSRFYPAEDIERGKPEYELKMASARDQFEDEGWRVRKDGSRFWASVVVTALRDPAGQLQGFSNVIRDLTDRRRAEEKIRRQNAQLEAANKELDAFGYSVAHDLQAPLRAIDGFSLSLLQDFPDQIPAEGARYLRRIRSGVQRMAQLIEQLLKLARVSRQETMRNQVDLSRIALEIAAQLQTSDLSRRVTFSVAPDLIVSGDRNLLRIMLENLMGNAWKFTSHQPQAEIELGAKNGGGERVLFIRDNGSGFNMEHAGKLFGVFQRLHCDSEFPGTGVGLATVQRIVSRHGGKIWGEGTVGKGATFYFVL